MLPLGGRLFVAALPGPGDALPRALIALHESLTTQKLLSHARLFHLATEFAVDSTPLQFQCETHPIERLAPPPLDNLLRLALSVHRWLGAAPEHIAVFTAHGDDRPHLAAAATRLVVKSAANATEALAGLGASMSASQRRYVSYLETLLAKGQVLHAPRVLLTAIRVDGAGTYGTVRLVVSDARGNMLFETEHTPRPRQVFMLFEMRVPLQADFRVAFHQANEPLAAISLHTNFITGLSHTAPLPELDAPSTAPPLLSLELYTEAADAPAVPPQQRFQLTRQSRRIFRRPHQLSKNALRSPGKGEKDLRDSGKIEKRDSSGKGEAKSTPERERKARIRPESSTDSASSPSASTSPSSSADRRRHTTHAERREKKAAEYKQLYQRSRTGQDLRPRRAEPSIPLRESAPAEVDQVRVEALRSALRPQQSHVWEIDPKELERGKRIAQGATAIVYRARFRGQRVAVKEFTEEASAQGEALDSLRKEFAVISAIRAPNVMLFFGALLRPRLAMVLELCERGSLFDVLNDGSEKISWKRVLLAAADTATGIACLHGWRPEIVHRDLKSLNLLVSRNWTVKVGDFGTSRFTWNKEGALLSNLAKIKGTYAYTPPELFFGELFTTKGDVYAYGVVLWELTTRLLEGRYYYPYYDTAAFQRPFQILVQAATKELRPRIHKNVPAPFAALIKSCWHEKPEQRPTAAECAKEARALIRLYKEQKEQWDAFLPAGGNISKSNSEGAGEPYADAIVESSSDSSSEDDSSSGTSSSANNNTSPRPSHNASPRQQAP